MNKLSDFDSCRPIFLNVNFSISDEGHCFVCEIDFWTHVGGTPGPRVGEPVDCLAVELMEDEYPKLY